MRNATANVREYRAVLPLGRVLATPGAIEALIAARCGGGELLDRHARADWGELDAHDRAANDAALVNGGRVLSAYTLLLPSEY